MSKSADAFRTISEVAEWLDTPAHVLRFWESKFTQVKPIKRAGGRRYYRPADMRLLGGIKKLLHEDGMTIKGVQKILREQGIKHVSSLCALSVGDDDLDDVVFDEVLDAEPVDTVVPFAKPEPIPDHKDEPLSAAEKVEHEVTEDVSSLSVPEPLDEHPVLDDLAAAPEPEEMDVAEAEPTATTTDVAAAPEAEPVALEPEPVAEEPRTEAPTAAKTEPTPSALPAFLQRSMSRPEDESDDESADASEPAGTEEPAPESAAPAEPAEPMPGALTHLARIRRLSAEDAARIAPIAERLKARVR